MLRPERRKRGTGQRRVDRHDVDLAAFFFFFFFFLVAAVVVVSCPSTSSGTYCSARWPAKAAIVLVTSLWFGLDHLQVQGLAGMEQALIVGLVFGAIYAVTGRLWLLIVAHAAFDLAALAIIYGTSKPGDPSLRRGTPCLRLRSPRAGRIPGCSASCRRRGAGRAGWSPPRAGSMVLGVERPQPRDLGDDVVGEEVQFERAAAGELDLLGQIGERLGAELARLGFHRMGGQHDRGGVAGGASPPRSGRPLSRHPRGNSRGCARNWRRARCASARICSSRRWRRLRPSADPLRSPRNPNRRG